MIDRATAQKIKDTADIVEVVSDYVHLVRRGANYMGLCPFHNERTPSFSVSRKKNFCLCFSCKKGGSPVGFLMEKEGFSYREALLHLAKKYGIEVQEQELTDEERELQSLREGMLVANEWAMKLMESNMTGTEEGRDVGLQYFLQRGVTSEAIKAFHLGYALENGSHLINEAKKTGFRIEILKQLGLVGTSQSGRDYDRFHGRVIFPILNNAGKVIAFGGRDLKGGIAKYINSPESELYKKSKELYGIFQARASIVREDKCFLVEGYMDVIGMWQSGMKNVVASSGTALTDGQIALIHRLTNNITLIYDGDAAGIKASLRGIDMLLSHKLNVKVLPLPEGDDPDSFASNHSPEEFKQYVADNETDIIRFKLRVLMSGEEAESPQHKIEVINSLAESIAHIPDPISRDVYIQECAKLLSMSDTSIAKSVGFKRNALIQKWKKEREWNKYKEDSDNGNSSAGLPSTIATLAHSDRQIGNNERESQSRSVIPIDYPFRPLEQSVVRYCLRYGYLFFCMAEDEDGNEIPMSVLEFVMEELEADGIHFSVPEYARTMELLAKMKNEYEAALNTRKKEIQEEIEIRRKASIEELGNSDLSVHELNIGEQKMEDELKEWASAQLHEFSKEYPSKILASHEDDQVRKTVTELMLERHQLSNIYAKDPTNVPEEDKLEILVTRAVNEWKGEILNLQMRDLMKKFNNPSSPISKDEERNIQTRLAAIMKLRQEVARNIGDRTLDPKRT